MPSSRAHVFSNMLPVTVINHHPTCAKWICPSTVSGKKLFDSRAHRSKATVKETLACLGDAGYVFFFPPFFFSGGHPCWGGLGRISQGNPQFMGLPILSRNQNPGR